MLGSLLFRAQDAIRTTQLGAVDHSGDSGVYEGIHKIEAKPPSSTNAKPPSSMVIRQRPLLPPSLPKTATELAPNPAYIHTCRFQPEEPFNGADEEYEYVNVGRRAVVGGVQSLSIEKEVGAVG